ncbi:IS1 family transposase [bacterium]|nr:IS1 family transposase [bacterium]
MNIRRPGWHPPHCPNPNCKHHRGLAEGWRYKRRGFFLRRIRPFRIQRFTCLTCGRNFSSQTFSTTYWQKRPELDAKILLLTVGCMANRQIARALQAAPSTIDRHIARLGRHCMLLHMKLLEGVPSPAEIIFDGFETFELSQYHPFHHNIAVEPDNGFFLYHTDSPLRRKGRMTDIQKQRREELEAELDRPDPKAVQNGIRELLEFATRGRTVITGRSDEHPAYRRSIAQIACRVRHKVTSSKDHRDKHNPLWEVNLADLMIRHSTAAHKRETIAWVKRRQSSAERLSIFMVWRNLMKRRWEKGPAVSSGMLKGVTDRLWKVRDVLAERIFRTRMDLPDCWDRYYVRSVSTAGLSRNHRHTLMYAY